MMATTKWDCKFITYLHAERTRLRKPKMMRIAGVTATNNAWLRSYEAKVRLVAPALWLRKRKDAFVDFYFFFFFACWRQWRRSDLRRPSGFDFWVLPVAVIARRAWDGCCIVGMKFEAGRGDNWRGEIPLLGCSAALAIQAFKPLL